MSSPEVLSGLGFMLTGSRAWGEGQAWGPGSATLLPGSPGNRARAEAVREQGNGEAILGSHHVDLQDALVGPELYLKTPVGSSCEPGLKSGIKSANEERRWEGEATTQSYPDECLRVTRF